ncbi:uncharacterized protein V6R79_016709 [Siganus canaliculatus]
MRHTEPPEKQLGALNQTETRKSNTSELHILDDAQPETPTLKRSHTHCPAIQPQTLNKLHVPKPPISCQAGCRTGRRKTHPAADFPCAVPVNLDPDSQYSDNRGMSFWFDDKGMLLPPIPGNLKDTGSCQKASEETELKQTPRSHRNSISEDQGWRLPGAVRNGCGLPPDSRDTQANALQNWQKHLSQRRQQQGFLSDHLSRPVEHLLMNQGNHFRATQERREFLSQVLPLVHSGHGYHVGSEFWSLPQRFGDEMSGITATLTQREQGRQEPVTHVAQPRSVQQESGIKCAGSLRPASHTWDQSTYLQHQYQELGNVLWDIDFKKPDMDGLEVIGSGKPSTFVTKCCSPLLEREEEEVTKKKESLISPIQYYDDRSDARHGPALRFCGQLAGWTGDSTMKQGEAGINARILFETQTGEMASSHLELCNEGSTAIFYSWQQLLLPHSFPNLQSHTKGSYFCFDSSSGVILPGETQQMEVLFKSNEPGIRTELWRLNTHPVLLQGASVQLTLRGLALKRNNLGNAQMCQTIVEDILQRVRTPERVVSSAELCFTEEQEFLSRNMKFQYHEQPVEDLRRLWHEINPGSPWDLSIDTLRQAVLSLPKHKASFQEELLTRLNCLVPQLTEPPAPEPQLAADAVGRMLWRNLLDRMVVEASSLRSLLGLPEKDTWVDKMEESQKSDGGRETMSPQSQDNRKKGKGRTDASKRSRRKGKQECASLTDSHVESSPQQPPDDPTVHREKMDTYTRLLHKKVYALMEDLVDSLGDVMDENNEQDV